VGGRGPSNPKLEINPIPLPDIHRFHAIAAAALLLLPLDAAETAALRFPCFS
jgi:hypothetical protein